MTQGTGARASLEVLAFSLGMCCFAAARHRWPAIAAVGLVASAAAAVHFVFSASSPVAIVGLRGASRFALPASVLALLLGLALAVLYRDWLGHSPLPLRLRPFGVLAVLIGVAEELLYRGYVQGRLSVLGAVGSIGLAAAAHTAYKSCLFIAPPAGHATNLALLAVCTFLGGVVFGGMRALTRSVAPPLIAHGCFDLVVYGELASAPWWVWS